jgi:diguanylate cyclase (GGDEF)-like protein
MPDRVIRRDERVSLLGILFKSTAVTIVVVIVSVLAAATIVPALGGVVDGNAWLMCVICPLVTAWPASSWMLWQSAKLRLANAELAAIHAELAAANAGLAERTRRDDMTGMLNRNAFLDVLEATRGREGRGGLLIVDADHFKAINDTYGHQAGDEALVLIAEAITRAVADGDVVGRIGGEEFAVLLTRAAAGDLHAAAERIRAEVEAIPFGPLTDTPRALTVSIGGTRCPPDAPVRDIMCRADVALYAAKRRGRNRAILDSDSVAA